jgi:hypothetical protein
MTTLTSPSTTPVVFNNASTQFASHTTSVVFGLTTIPSVFSSPAETALAITSEVTTTSGAERTGATVPTFSTLVEVLAKSATVANDVTGARDGELDEGATSGIVDDELEVEVEVEVETNGTFRDELDEGATSGIVDDELEERIRLFDITISEILLM